MSGDLWAVHVIGPDDVLPCASRRLAVRNATWSNLALASEIDRLDDDMQPLVYHVPIRWDGDPQEHSDVLARIAHEDPRWSDPAATVIADMAGYIQSTPEA